MIERKEWGIQLEMKAVLMIKKIWYKLRLDKCYGLFMSFIDRYIYMPIDIYDVDKTVSLVVENNYSVARFGDGELSIAQEGCPIGFQESSEELKMRLREILSIENTIDLYNLLVCLPSPIKDYSYMTDEAVEVWKNALRYKRHSWNKMINCKNVYGDTQFTRPYIDYKDKSKSKSRFIDIKGIWKNRKILLIEGEKSRLGVNNDLFSEVKELKRLLCPSENAFAKYDDIIIKAREFSKEYLVLIALGPTATVLAFDLAKEGYQAIDIGHLDIEYEWCKLGVEKKIPIKGKYTNESNHNQNLEDECDEGYLSQIVGRV